MKIMACLTTFTEGDDDVMHVDEGRFFIEQALKTLEGCSEVHDVTLVHESGKNIPPFISPALECVGVGNTDRRALTEWPFRSFNMTDILSVPDDVEAVLILSPRNPLITSALLARAIDHFKCMDWDVMVSVRASVMHPCQLFTGRPVSAGAAELFLPDRGVLADKVFFPDVPGLWSRNPDGTAVNAMTGKPITGRQDFPQTVEPDGSFAMARKAWIQAGMDKTPGLVHGFRLLPHESLCVRSRLDMLKFRAIQKAAVCDCQRTEAKGVES